MTKEEYRKAREKIGTQDVVAVLLGIDEGTISRRERGETAISNEAAQAMESLLAKYRPASRSHKCAEFIFRMAKIERNYAVKGRLMECGEEIEFLFSELEARQKNMISAMNQYAEADTDKKRRVSWERMLVMASLDGGEVCEKARGMHI